MKFPAHLLSSICLLFLGCKAIGWAEVVREMPPEAGRRFLTRFDAKVIDAHEQRQASSCIPSSMEMVLKLLGRAPESYYDLQDAWQNRTCGGFVDFDRKTIAGVTFHLQFALPSTPEFPLAALFETIHRELSAGRFVIASLANSGGWHMWVIYDETVEGEFLAVSKDRRRTLWEPRAKEAIRKMQGTHICVYEFPCSPLRLPSAPPHDGPPLFNHRTHEIDNGIDPSFPKK